MIEALPGLADDDDMLLSEHIVKDLDQFEQVKFMDESLDITELIRYVVALTIVHQPQTANIRLQLKVDWV